MARFAAAVRRIAGGRVITGFAGATADSIRDVLTHLGLVIEDTPDGARRSLD